MKCFRQFCEDLNVVGGGDIAGTTDPVMPLNRTIMRRQKTDDKKPSRLKKIARSALSTLTGDTPVAVGTFDLLFGKE